MDLDTDTVEQEYGREFSENTLDVLRSNPKPSYLQELEDSLDPVDDLDDYIAHGIKIPPATYEALQEAGKEDIQALSRMRDAPIDPEMQAVVRYRQQLAEGTSPKDLAWLKTRAYYRGMERIRVQRDAQKAVSEAQRMAEYDVPTDRVPAEALSITAVQAAARRKQHLAFAAAKARRARSKGASSPQSEDLLELESEDSELLQQQQDKQLSPEIRDALSAQLVAYAARRAAMMQASGLGEGADVSPQGTAAAASQGVGQQQQIEADRREKRKQRTIYTEAYLQQQQLGRRVRQQQRQRSMAFWMSLATVSGTYLVKYLRKRWGGKGEGKGASKEQAKASKAVR